MVRRLPEIHSPADLKKLSPRELTQLAEEIREELRNVVETRSAHFASNLGVVELTLALHTVFDFSYDRLIWDVGHQCYPHKMVTGRYDRFSSIRTLGGLMGYPNPAESPYDLFMTGHAGCSISSALGLKCGDDLIREIEKAKAGRPERHVVAVIGDGSFANGVVFEGLNHLGASKKNVTVILNDNQMAICPRVGSMGQYLDTLRMSPRYTEIKADIKRVFESIPILGHPMRQFLHYTKNAVKAQVLGGMLFEELGIRYIGPVDGHNIRQLQKFLRMVRNYDCPVLLHVFTKKGHGYQPAEDDPAKFHAPPPLRRSRAELRRQEKLQAKLSRMAGEDLEKEKEKAAAEVRSDHSFTVVASHKIQQLMERDARVVVITAAMCQGNKLEQIRSRFPDRFFDVGICESHAVTLAGGMAKSGLKPIVDIYSTFMQRAYDHLFQEVSLQNLPVTLLMDRAGLVGADGPTHHGMYDLAYLRPLPNMVMSVPGDAAETEQMLELAVTCGLPFAIRYPKTQTAEITGLPRQAVALGKSEVLLPGIPGGGLVLACGTQVADALDAIRGLRAEKEIGLVNVRFVKPLDTATLFPLVRRCGWLLTIEEGAKIGGFGSAVLEALTDADISLPKFRRLGVGDRFIPHATRQEQLEMAGLDTASIMRVIEEMQKSMEQSGYASHHTGI
ncbi:MAG: 1-deoxy-D-xylulose-5-phosphate synthase [Planctomycetia bacterium]|nr:1-deoxy-D-xylulose-5-phosphate synthase [Planctomycetia bacterium]